MDGFDIANHSGDALICTVALSKDVKRLLAVVPDAASDVKTLNTSLHTMEKSLVSLRYLDDLSRFPADFSASIKTVVDKYQLIVLDLTTSILILTNDAENGDVLWSRDNLMVRQYINQIARLTMLMNWDELALGVKTAGDIPDLTQDVANIDLRPGERLGDLETNKVDQHSDQQEIETTAPEEPTVTSEEADAVKHTILEDATTMDDTNISIGSENIPESVIVVESSDQAVQTPTNAPVIAATDIPASEVLPVEDRTEEIPAETSTTSEAKHPADASKPQVQSDVSPITPTPIQTRQKPTVFYANDYVLLGQIRSGVIDLAFDVHHPFADDDEASIVRYLTNAVLQINTGSSNISNTTDLHIAAATFDLAYVEDLVSSSADVNAESGRGITPIHLAMTNAWILQEIVNRKKSTDSETAAKATAVLKNAIPCVRLLLDAGADINAKFDHGTNFLHEIMLTTDQTYLKPLLDWGIDVNARDRLGRSALHMAQGIATMRKLLNAGADINAKAYSGQNVLHTAFQQKDHTTAKLLLERGADANYTTKEGNSFLHLTNDTEFVKMFIAAGANVNAKNDDLETPLHTWHNKHAITELLLDAGADPNIRDKDGETPLYQAIRDQNSRSVKLLLKKGADVNIKQDSEGRAPLHRAVAEKVNDPEFVKLLIEAKADVDVRDLKGRTPLYYACTWGHEEHVKKLLAAGAKIHLKSDEGKRPFIRAVYFNYPNLVRIFLNHGEDANKPDADGLTPLQVVIQHRHKGYLRKSMSGMLTVLLDFGADVNAPWPGSFGPFTCLTYAMEYGDLPSVMVLTKYGAVQRDVKGKPNASKLYQSEAFTKGACKRYIHELGDDWFKANKEPGFEMPACKKATLAKYKKDHNLEIQLPEEYQQPPFNRWKDAPRNAVYTANARLLEVMHKDVTEAIKKGKSFAKSKGLDVSLIDLPCSDDEGKNKKP